MKNSTKWIATVATAAAIFFSVNVKAQTTDKSAWRLGFGVEGGIPTGSLNTSPAYSKFELGGTARLQYGIQKNLALTLTSGYYNFFATQAAKDVGGESFGVVPVKVGVKGFFTENLYFGAEAGAGFETKYDKNTKLILSPAFGWANKSWDVGVRYENLSGQSDSYGIVGLRLAYGFSL
ncbi:hypothetical protein [Mucilaginibacter xinganensis]|uniref:Outer membrane protein beta-barrel domain-containing protein n=1 Tax=Mucilaginibacter xinganensis TaxID=1234841 RepID=A0A223NXH5_9SPHI|nr:hypothetical protein [Mucilaginibacter xinganensis]ASU34288.1 hypothetical protein MuYL_2401 [Mucilaginibacter xinganensis]